MVGKKPDRGDIDTEVGQHPSRRCGRSPSKENKDQSEGRSWSTREKTKKMADSREIIKVVLVLTSRAEHSRFQYKCETMGNRFLWCRYIEYPKI